MTIKEKIALSENIKNLVLYKEGIFYKLYNQHAMLFSENIRAFNNVGSNGNYWSSTVSGTNARYLTFYSSNAAMNSNNRANGFSVRCIKDKIVFFAMLF